MPPTLTSAPHSQGALDWRRTTRVRLPPSFATANDARSWKSVLPPFSERETDLLEVTAGSLWCLRQDLFTSPTGPLDINASMFVSRLSTGGLLVRL